MADLLLGVWLGGATCYLGMMLVPTATRLPLGPLVCLALMWPAALVLAHREGSQ